MEASRAADAVPPASGARPVCSTCGAVPADDAAAALARVTWTRTDPANLDRVVEAYRDSLMPWWEQTEGFRSNSLLMDRQEGRCSSTVVFESRDAMARSDRR